jgi:hypothetical protein
MCWASVGAEYIPHQHLLHLCKWLGTCYGAIEISETNFLRRFIMNESALCYRRMSGCMYVTKCIVTKLQMLQTSPLAQIYLLTIEIDLPSDVGKYRHFDHRPPS